MSNILAVRVFTGNRLLFYRSDPYVVSPGDHVLIQVEGELQMGVVERITPISTPESASPPDVDFDLSVHGDSEPGTFVENISAIFRPATEEDLIRNRENRELARTAHDYCRQCIQERGLEMKLVDVEVLFDCSKIIFYFTAPNRIDFRELVKDLVRSYRTRIELRQIGARHETQMLGGIGNCGQLVCCQRFLRQFAPSTIKMAKEQNLFLNPAKISGVCNRLLCCLSYEQPNYDEFLNQCPKIGKRYATTHGSAKVLRANYFRRTLSIFTEPGGEKEVGLEEWSQLVAVQRDAGPPPKMEKPIQVKSVNLPVSVDAALPVPVPDTSVAASSPNAKSRPRKKPRKAGRPDGRKDSGAVHSGKSKRRSRSSRRKSKKQSLLSDKS
jgi:cell fate regulator YaaT (PSP1 superfamily)